MRGALAATHMFSVFSLSNVTPLKCNLQEVKLGIQGSAGLGSGVYVRMLGTAIVGHGGGYAGAIGAGRDGDSASCRSSVRVRFAPTLYIMPDTATILLLKLYSDGTICIGVHGANPACHIRSATVD